MFWKVILISNAIAVLASYSKTRSVTRHNFFLSFDFVMILHMQDQLIYQGPVVRRPFSLNGG